jgi:drug/metabolite transporter (DMT)-like permease
MAALSLSENRKIGFTSFLVAAVLYGTFGLLIRFLQNELTAVQQLTLRSFGAILFSLIFAFGARSDWTALKQKRVWGFGLAFPVSVILWTLAVTYGTVRSAVFGLYFGALISSAFLGWKLYSESLTKYNFFSLLLALVAAVVFSLPFSTLAENQLALLLGTIAGCVQSLNLCYRRWLGDVSRPLVVLVQSMGGFFVTLIICFFTSSKVPQISTATLVAGLLFGAVVVLVSYLLLIGSKNLEINKGSLILSTELIWATLFAALFLNEIPTPQQSIGCVLLLAALAIARVDSAKKGSS